MARQLPDTHTIGGRLKAERRRLGFSQPAFAALASAHKNSLVNWERDVAFPNAQALAAFGSAGADVLFIVMGRRRDVKSAATEGLPGVTVRQALAMLDPVDRHRLLLDLIAEEMRG